MENGRTATGIEYWTKYYETKENERLQMRWRDCLYINKLQHDRDDVRQLCMHEQEKPLNLQQLWKVMN